MNEREEFPEDFCEHCYTPRKHLGGGIFQDRCFCSVIQKQDHDLNGLWERVMDLEAKIEVLIEVQAYNLQKIAENFEEFEEKLQALKSGKEQNE